MDYDDAINTLIDGAVQHMILNVNNPYVSYKTIVLRLYNQIKMRTRVEYGNHIDKTTLFYQWHEEIFSIFDSIKSNMSHDERVSIERVLSQDCPHPNELNKFANSFYKYDPVSTCRWFAVDGFLGNHPKNYVQDAFSKHFETYNTAVRLLYNHFTDPEKIKKILEYAAATVMKDDDDDDKSSTTNTKNDSDTMLRLFGSDVQCYVKTIIETIGEQEELGRIVSERLAKSNQQQESNNNNKRKRKKITTTTTPAVICSSSQTFEPHSPPPEPSNKIEE